MRLVKTCDGGYKKLPGRPVIASQGRSAHNLMAEYAAVVAALRWVRRAALPSGVQVEIQSDSQFVVDRLTGGYTVRRKLGTVMLHRTAGRNMDLLRRDGCQVVLRHVPRKEVSAAHHLCARVYRSEMHPTTGPGSHDGYGGVKLFLLKEMSAPHGGAIPARAGGRPLVERLRQGRGGIRREHISVRHMCLERTHPSCKSSNPRLAVRLQNRAPA